MAEQVAAIISTTEAPELSDDRNSPPASGRRERSIVALAAWLAGTWVVVVAAYLLHAAVVLPILLTVALAAFLRGGRTLLDRLMLAIAVLIGTTCAAALLFAVWPWGMHPIAVAGTAFTAIIVIAHLTGRRPNLPRARIGDVLALGGAAVAAAFAAVPVLGPVNALLNRVMGGEDYARHVDVFVAIQRTGGYLFQQPDAAREHVYNGMVTYPQGSHMIAALLDGFLRSGTGDPGGLAALRDFMGFVIGWYGLLVLVMIWTAQWLAGGRLSLGRRIVLVTFITVFCLASEPLALILWGYPSELVGVIEAVLLIAVLARPVPRIRQQMLTVVSLVVAIGFTYYLFLPPALLAGAIWMLRYRRLLLRHRIFVSATIIVGGIAAVTPILLGITVGGQGQAVSVPGGPRASRLLLLVLACLLIVGLFNAVGRRSRIWRGYVWSLLSVAALYVGLAGVQHLNGQSAGYYANKSTHLLLVVLAVGIAALVNALPPPVPQRGPARERLLRLVPALVLAVAVVAGYGLMRGGPIKHPTPTSNWALVYRGHFGRGAGASAAVLQEYNSRAGQRPVVTFLVTDDPFLSYVTTLYLGTLEGTSGLLAPGIYNGEKLDSPTRLQNMVATINGPVRIVAATDDAFAEAERVRADFPDRPIEVVRSP